MRKYARDKGTFRGPSDDQDDHGPTVFDRLLFFNMFKNSSRSLFRYPTLGGLRRSRQIFPRRYRVVRDSARRFPTIFAKMRPIDQKRIGYYRDQKKDRVLSGPKQSLVKWPLYANWLAFIHHGANRGRNKQEQWVLGRLVKNMCEMPKKRLVSNNKGNGRGEQYEVLGLLRKQMYTRVRAVVIAKTYLRKVATIV